MTQPSPDNQGQQQGQRKAKVKALDLVEYTHRDRIFGGEHQAVGVVVKVGGDNESVTIRPLDHHTVEVDPADIAGTVTADDV